jgi:hypothetical protein
MKNFYTIFDMDLDRVGISNLYSNSSVFIGPAPVLKPTPISVNP